MDMVEEATNDFQDWEVLQPNSDSSSVSFDDEIDSGGLIQADYFSLNSQNRYAVVDLDDNKSAQSDNPSWIDPGLDEENPSRYLNKESTEFWSDSSSGRSEDHRKFTDFQLRVNEMVLNLNEKRQVSFEGIREIVEEKGEKEVAIEMDDSAKVKDLEENSEVSLKGRLNLLDDESEVLSEVHKNENEKIGNQRRNENEKGVGVVWWQMPVEILKYCVFRMSPVWRVSVAAAVMGLVILGRRAYMMKKKTTMGLQIKVTVDDKKVSQVMSRAARLNEAFSVVKRVPVIRPTMSATSTTWPAMSVR